ncbi:MAG: DUF1622 domain-containing protein [Hyphomicrobiaceae bacterium]
MLEAVETLLPTIITVLELVAAGLLVLGFVLSTGFWLRDGLLTRDPAARTRYRGALARSILIGLEVLTAATIIKTVTLTPTFDSMIALVAMVAIRTVLGWTTSLEMNGRWPWQPEPRRKNR